MSKSYASEDFLDFGQLKVSFKVIFIFAYLFAYLVASRLLPQAIR